MKVKLQIPGKETNYRFIDTEMPVMPEVGESLDIAGEDQCYVVFKRVYQFSESGAGKLALEVGQIENLTECLFSEDIY